MNRLINNLIRKITSSKLTILKPINLIIYRYIHNNLYKINEVIRKSEIVDNTRIKIEVNNGDKLTFTKSKSVLPNHLLNKLKFSNKNKIKNIIEYENYFFIYDLIDEIYVHGSWNLNKLNYSEYNTIIDVGANIGGFSINAKNSAKKNTQYYLLEPEEKNIGDLEYNLNLNSIQNYKVIPKGLWSSDTSLTFYISNRAGEHSVIKSEEYQNEKVTIDAITIETLFNSNNIQFPVLMKMDIEGAELEVIRSSINFLKKQKGLTLFIEALHFVDGKETYKDIVPILEANNFEIISLEEKYRGIIYAINR